MEIVLLSFPLSKSCPTSDKNCGGRWTAVEEHEDFFFSLFPSGYLGKAAQGSTLDKCVGGH